jgi:hypothetical protein
MFDWLKNLFGGGYTPTPGTPVMKSKPVDQVPIDPYMDEGDFHSGPHGYSPNTAYPETQYGSSFDEDAQWNEEH